MTAAPAAGPAWWLLLVAAPVLEEVAARWGLHDWLLARGATAWHAVGVVALVFGAAHVAAWGQMAGAWTVLPALLVGWAYAHWRRLDVCVAMHAGLNAVWLVLLAMGLDPQFLGLRPVV